MLFLSVGAATAFVSFSVFTVFWEVVRSGYPVALSIAYAAAVAFHFIMNRTFTFRRGGANLAQHLAKYGVTVFINYLVTLTVAGFAVSGLSLSPYIGTVLAMGATFVIGYLLSRFWVFRA